MRRIFFDVIEVNIGISVIILLVCLLERKFRKRYGAGWLKMVWVLLAVRLLIPYNFSLPFTELRLLNDPQFEQEEEGLFPWQTTEKSMDTEVLTVDTVTTESEYAQAQYSSADRENEQKRNESTDAFSLSYATIFTAIWIVGLGAGLWYFFIANINFNGKCKHTLRKISGCSLVNHINELQEQMLGTIALPVFESDVVSSPMLVGLITPKLVLPSDKEHWKEDELNWIVTHEICHYQSKDLWIKMVLMLVWCLNWFNPFVYIMKKRCYFHIELSCDEKVLKGHEKEKRGEYAGVLLAFASGRQEVSSFTTHFGDSKKRMKKRIDNMLDMGKKRKGVVAFLILFLSMVVNCMYISCGYKPLEEKGNDAEYVKQIYRILHDMDYFLLRYGPEDVGKYTKNDSTVRNYYGVLMVYGEEKQ